LAFLGQLIKGIANLSRFEAGSFFQAFNGDPTAAFADHVEDVVEHGRPSRRGFNRLGSRCRFFDRPSFRRGFGFFCRGLRFCFFTGALVFFTAADFFAGALAFLAAFTFFAGAAFPLSFSMAAAIFSTCLTREDSVVEIANSSF
jgi:hypothetical protein